MSSSPLDSFSACSASLASKRSDAVRPAALHACLNCLISRFRVTNAGESSLLPGSHHELTTQPGCDAKAEGHSHFQGKAVGDHNRDASGLFVPVRMPNVHVRALTFVSAEEADEICVLPSRDPVKRRAQPRTTRSWPSNPTRRSPTTSPPRRRWPRTQKPDA